MKVEGACHCGQITYEADVNPEQVMLCNCTDCQMLTGSAFRVLVSTPAPDFRLLTGHPKTYVKTAESGARRRQMFCANCGTPVVSSADIDDPKIYTLRIGCLKQRAELPPRKRIWCKSALAWGQDVSGVPGIDRQ